MPYFTLWMLDFFNTIWVSNGLNQDQVDILYGLIWVQTVCKGYQQTKKSLLAGKELNTKQLVDTRYSLILAKILAKVNFIWL